MINSEQVQECLKNDVIGKCLEYIKKELENNKCLPPDEIPCDGYINPRTSLLRSIERQLEHLYEDAQKVAKIDLTVLGQ